MTRLLVVLIAAAVPAFGQRSEVGATVGAGAISAEDVTTSDAVAFGAEFCALCSGGVGFFGEYSHLEAVGTKHAYEISRFDLIAGGIRLQGGRRVRPFFDAGIAYGVDSFLAGPRSDSHGNVGIVLAGGAAIGFRDRMYVRPQVRLYALRGLHVVAAATAAVGLRF